MGPARFGRKAAGRPPVSRRRILERRLAHLDRAPVPEDPLLSVDEALAFLAVRGLSSSRSTLDRMRARGELHAVKAKGRTRVKAK